MYYKIENKKCDVYKELHAMREKELQIEKDNVAAIERISGLTFKTFVGHRGQQNFRRVTEYISFEFIETDKIDLSVWQLDKEFPTTYIPNRKTKAGKAMTKALNDGLRGSSYDFVIGILKLNDELRRFTFPYVEIVGDVIVIFLGNGHEPKDKNCIEITKKEFDEI